MVHWNARSDKNGAFPGVCCGGTGILILNKKMTEDTYVSAVPRAFEPHFWKMVLFSVQPDAARMAQK
jgi:hypothetical protein